MTTQDSDKSALKRGDFPKEFLWGCATSAFQIEGAAHADDRVESIWDRFCAQPGHVRDGSNAEQASDHYHRWAEDLDIAKTLGLNAYRFSIAWPRIFSENSAKPNQNGLDFYSRLIDGQLERGLQPWATLYHWDLPQALQEKGGWNQRDTVYAYLEYVDTVTRHLGDRVKHWITHNEPWCTAMHGHLDGIHAPGLRDLKTALQVSHHVLLSHGLAIPIIRQNAPQAKVGIALSLHPLRAASDSLEDIAATRRHDGLRNRWFLDPLHDRGYPADTWHTCGDAVPDMQPDDLRHIATLTDFLGINYYFPEVIAHAPEAYPMQTRLVHLPDKERTAFGWEVAPQGMADLLRRVKRDYATAPIYITENGATYEDIVEADGSIKDEKRRDFYIRHLSVLKKLVAEGLDIRGYFAWSLIDNFEWAEGYQRRFGLVHVDFETQKRTIKASGKWYAAFLAGGDK